MNETEVSNIEQPVEFCEVRKICNKFKIYPDTEPTKLVYRPIRSLLQTGPQCGIVAVAMCMDGDNKHIEDIFNQAKKSQMTLNGEMFSAQDMFELVTRNVKCTKVVLHEGVINCKKIIDFLTNGGIMIVPYDKDGNHSPCKKRGHKAHWAVVSGILMFGNDIFVLAKHGKSNHLSIWPLSDLSESNEQLMEFSPDRELSGVEYILPLGGIGGPNGIANKAILIYGLCSNTEKNS